eukprot:11288084-Alexandrium_andersonii.AAC.1
MCIRDSLRPGGPVHLGASPAAASRIQRCLLLGRMVGMDDDERLAWPDCLPSSEGSVGHVRCLE